MEYPLPKELQRLIQQQMQAKVQADGAISGICGSAIVLFKLQGAWGLSPDGTALIQAEPEAKPNADAA